MTLETRQTVILAAGYGSRLAAQRGELPKPLVKVAGGSLLDHALGQAVAAGVSEAIIITGKGADQIEAHLAQVRLPLKLTLVHNQRYDQPNGVSLLAAAPYVTGGFYLQMADHLFAQPVLARLAAANAAPEGMGRLLVDFHPVGIDEADATKVRVTGGRISHIGKELHPYDGVDTGYFRLEPEVFDALREVARWEPPSVTLGMRKLIERGRFAAVELTGVRWTDIDTPEDYAKAELLLAAQRRRSVGDRAGAPT